MLITEGSGSGKINVLYNLIGSQPDIDKIHLYAKDTCDAKFQIVNNKREGLKENNDSKALSNTRMTWTTFIEILKNTIQRQNTKY